jgi:hypothetical protein
MRDVEIGPGQTVDLGTATLTPEDSQVPGYVLVELATAYHGVTDLFTNPKNEGGLDAGTQAQQIVKEYFTGVGVPQQYVDGSQVLYTSQIANWTLNQINTFDSYQYVVSTSENPSVAINNPSEVDSFRSDPTTSKALEATLTKIINSGLANLAIVQRWVAPYETSGSISAPLSLDLPTVMGELGLTGWQDVTMRTEAAESSETNHWEFSGNGEAEFLAGGVGVGGRLLETLDNRVLTGTLRLFINCSGTVTVVPSFYVTVQDTFDFNPLPPINNVNIGVYIPVVSLASLEGLGLTSRLM